MSSPLSSTDALRERRRGQRRGDRSTAVYNATDTATLLPETKRRRRTVDDDTTNVTTVWHWAFLLVYLLLLLVVIVYLHGRVPEPKPLSTPVDQFSEARSRLFVEELASFGLKPAGSDACEVQSVALIERELAKIRRTMNTDVHVLDTDIQRPSGCFHMPRLGSFALCYNKIVNVVARLGPKGRSPTKHSVLINCHFDSWPDSPGASDDGVSCAVMMETLRAYATRNTTFEHDIIFLFNGAEENILMAAHGFITQHPWRHSIRAFLNLEAAGAGGREILFQAGPGNQWLLDTYLASVPYPHCSVMGQEVFDAGLVPGDTDFRIFRDHGKLSGMDLAYIRNGYVYHTEFDTPKFLTRGTMQRAGENVHELLAAMVASPYLVAPGDHKHGRTVFYDIVGVFVLMYPYWLGEMMNYAAVVVVVLKIGLNAVTHRREVAQGDKRLRFNFVDMYPLLTSYGISHLLTAFLLHVTILGCIVSLRALHLSMCWYATHSLLLLVYIAPMIATGMAMHIMAKQFVWKEKLPSLLLERVIFDAQLVWNSVILGGLTYVGIASAFFWLILVVGGLMRTPIRVATNVICGRLSRVSYFFALFPTSVMLIYSNMMLLDLFIPIMGRSLTLDSEVPIAIFCWLTSIGIVITFSSYLYTTRTRTLVKILAAICVGIALGYAIIATTSLGRPYKWNPDQPRVRRLHMNHMLRRRYAPDGSLLDDDNWLTILPADHRGHADLPTDSDFPQNHRPVECREEYGKYCNLPYYVPVVDMLPPEYFRYVNAKSRFTPPTETKLDLVKTETLSDSDVKFHFYISGSDHIGLQITPQCGWEMVGWSHGSLRFLRDQTTFLYLAYGQTPVRKGVEGEKEHYSPWEMWIQLNKVYTDDSPFCTKYNAKVQLGVASQFVHGPHMRSKELQAYMDNVARRRENIDDWKWAMTIGGWDIDFLIKLF